LFSLFRTRQEARLDRLMQQLAGSARQCIDRERLRLTGIDARLTPQATQRLLTEQHRLELLLQRTTALDPQLILNRGYSITLLNGHALRDPAQASPGDLIETRLEKGVLHSTVATPNP